MSKTCSHLDGIKTVKPSARGCEECLKTGSPWVHLRSAEPAVMLAVEFLAKPPCNGSLS